MWSVDCLYSKFLYGPIMSESASSSSSLVQSESSFKGYLNLIGSMTNEEWLYSVDTTIGRVGACGVASERVDPDGVGWVDDNGVEKVDDDGVEKVDDGGVERVDDGGFKKLDDDSDDNDEDDENGQCWGFNEGAAGQSGRDRLPQALCGRHNVFARALVGGIAGKARAFRGGGPFGFNDALSDVSSILTVDSVLELAFLDFGRAPWGRWEGPRPQFLLP